MLLFLKIWILPVINYGAKIKMKIKNKIVMIAFIITVFLVILSMMVSPMIVPSKNVLPIVILSNCPKPEYRPFELRSDIRTIVLGYLSDPSSVIISTNEIRDLVNFYIDEKGKPLVSDGDCESTIGTNSRIAMSIIIAKKDRFKKECNDGIDNDVDGLIDFPFDYGCINNKDNDETNCGDSVCEGGETCASCNYDCSCAMGALGVKDRIDIKDKCGDGVCEGGETCASCSSDCPCTGRIISIGDNKPKIKGKSKVESNLSDK